MSKKQSPDYILIGLILFLIIFGILILTSVSASISQERFGQPTYFLFHQLIFGLIPGCILGYLAFRASVDFLKRWSIIFLFINLLAMLLVFFPGIGLSLGGAHRWISLGPFSFQPSEFLKMTFVLYLAAWVSSRIEIKKTKAKSIKPLPQSLEVEKKALLPFLLILSIISLFLIFQPDISTLGIIVITATLIYFLAGTPVYHTILIFLIGIGGLFLLIKTSFYRFNRFITFLNPEMDPMGIGYQIKQALIAVGSGGILGQGLGASLQKTGFLPHPISDSIFAILAEETGFLGSFTLVLLFLIFAWRGFYIAKKNEDKFSQLVALGITLWIVLQAFVNIGAMLGILPLTGIPLPFLSYGGSALIAELIGAGILLNISQYSRN